MKSCINANNKHPIININYIFIRKKNSKEGKIEAKKLIKKKQDKQKTTKPLPEVTVGKNHDKPNINTNIPKLFI